MQLTHVMYVRQATAENIPVVRRPDRKDLLAYLNGTEIPTQVKRAAEESLDSGSIKRSCFGETHVQEVKRAAEESLNSGSIKKPRFDETHAQKFKEQLAARLVTPIEDDVSVQNIQSLLEAMSVEKIADIKAKRLVKKRTTIKDTDDIGTGSDLRVKLDMDVDDTKNIVPRIREGRTRTTILQSSGKVFYF